MGVIIYRSGPAKSFPKRIFGNRVGRSAVKLQFHRQPGRQMIRMHVCGIMIDLLRSSRPGVDPLVKLVYSCHDSNPIQKTSRKYAGSWFITTSGIMSTI